MIEKVVLMKLFRLFFIVGAISATILADRREYEFTNEPIDVVIPCHRKDCGTLKKVIEGIRQNIEHRRIIIVSSEPLAEGVEWFDEKKYPFSMEEIAYEIFLDRQKAKAYLSNKDNRIGWVYQQFLKLYAAFVIPGISRNILIIDADTIFLNPVTFQNEKREPLFNIGNEFHAPYFRHMDRLLPGLGRVFPGKSGITHHMLYQRSVLQDLFEEVEHLHNEDFWKAMCHCVDTNEMFSCFSEYELYFNFLFSRSDQPKIRILRWKNLPFRSFAKIDKRRFDYVSCHTWFN